MNEYLKLLSDTAQFIKQNYAPGDTLLVPGRAPTSQPPPPAPVQKKQTPPPAPKVQTPPPIPDAAPKKPEETPREQLNLQPLEAPLIEKADALRELLARVAPDFALRETPPDDTGAQRIRDHWKEDRKTAAVVILSFTENEKELLFYKNIARAIDQSLLPAKLVDGRNLEKEKKWDSFLSSSQLQWILLSQDQLKKGMDLLRHFRENPATSEQFLGQASLLLLAPPSTYFKQPGLKKTLWETLCTRLSS